MRSQHQGIYCEQNDRKHSRGYEGLGWEQHKHIHIGENSSREGESLQKGVFLRTVFPRGGMGSASPKEE